MFERCFIAFVDNNLSDDVQHVVLAAAGELFNVVAEFDVADTSANVVPSQPSELKWITVKSRSIDDAEDAKKYILACFSPQCKCTENVVDELVRIIQDDNGLWWRTLEQQFKVRLDLANCAELMAIAQENDSSAEETPFELRIQGLEEGVAYASSYISELNMHLKSPPVMDAKIDGNAVRSQFVKEIANVSRLDVTNYIAYNPYVLRTLLKWIYFIKGVQPSNKDYLLNLTPKQDDSIIILEKQDDFADLIELDKVANDDVTVLNNSVEVITIDDNGIGPVVDINNSLLTPLNAVTTNVECVGAKRKSSASTTGTGSDNDYSSSPASSSRGVFVRPKDPNEKVPIVNAESGDVDRHEGLNDSVDAASNAPATSSYTSISDQGKMSRRPRTPSEIFDDIYAKAGVKITHRKAKRSKRSQSKSHSDPHAAEKKEITSAASTDLLKSVTKESQPQQPPKPHEPPEIDYAMLRPVVLDGSNLAMQHGRHKIFSCRGILLACKHFIQHGHWVVAFVPQHREFQNPNNPNRPMTDQYLLEWMEKKGLVIYTPSRCIFTEDGRRRISCYDDNMIVEFAHKQGGVIVSKDHYRDVMRDCPQWQDTIHNRLLMYSWVNDVLMVPIDPMGKGGPTLDTFLRFQPGEIVAQAYKTLNAESCRSLVHDIEEIMCAPPPQPDEFRSRRWNPNYSGYRYNQNTFNNNFGFNNNRQFLCASSETDPSELKPKFDAPQFQAGSQWFPPANNHASRADWSSNPATFPNNIPLTDNGTSGGFPRGSGWNDGSTRSRSTSRQRNTWANGQYDNNAPQQSFPTTSGFPGGPPTTLSDEDTLGNRDHLVRKLSEIFPRDLIVRVMRSNKNVTDLQVLSNLITDEMNTSV